MDAVEAAFRRGVDHERRRVATILSEHPIDCVTDFDALWAKIVTKPVGIPSRFKPEFSIASCTFKPNEFLVDLPQQLRTAPLMGSGVYRIFIERIA